MSALASIELEVDDLREETQEMVGRDLREKIKNLKENNAEEFEIMHYEVVMRKLEVYGDIDEQEH